MTSPGNTDPAPLLRHAGLADSTDVEEATELPGGTIITDGPDLMAKGLTEEQVFDVLADKYDEEKAYILSLESQEGGIDIASVDSFCQSYGIPLRTVRLLTPEDYQSALEMIGSSSVDTDGMCLSYHDLILVKRDPEAESSNGAGYIESLMVHERTHADLKEMAVMAIVGDTEESGVVKASEISVATVRKGFIRRNLTTGALDGTLVEELRPELMRGIYVRDVLGLPDGFAGRAGYKFDADSAHLSKYSMVASIPAIGEPPTLDLFPGAAVASIFELLQAKDPGLFEALSNTKGVDEEINAFGQRINMIIPGFFEQLMSFDANNASQMDQVGQMYRVLPLVLQSSTTLPS